MSESKDQIDSPENPPVNPVDNQKQTIENEIKKAENEQIDKNKSKDLKLNDKEDKEDFWVVWGQLIGDWDNQFKKNTQYVKVNFAFSGCIPPSQSMTIVQLF